MSKQTNKQPAKEIKQKRTNIVYTNDPLASRQAPVDLPMAMGFIAISLYTSQTKYSQELEVRWKIVIVNSLYSVG